MMVGVPVLLVVCVSAPVPPVWVMAVGVGVFWWCVFQYWVAVVWASSVVPGVPECLGVVVGGVGVVVFWLVSCVGGLVVWLCVSGVVVVVVVGVGVFWWFRMLTCLASFFFLGFVSCLFCLVWLITGCFGFGVLVCVFVVCSGCLLCVVLFLFVGCGGWCWCERG